MGLKLRVLLRDLSAACGQLSRVIRSGVFEPGSFLCRLLRNIGVGRFIFRLRIVVFGIRNLFGHFNQRSLEYPWVLRQLKHGQGRMLLDFGCSGSLLDHELLARRFRVVGLDIQDSPLLNGRETFIQSNLLSNDLSSETFDVVLSVSTIEHVGLDVYGQDILSDGADVLAIQELRRLLKPEGILVLTTPYEGKGPARIYRSGDSGQFLERRYDCERLDELLRGFDILRSTYFLCMLGPRIKFLPVEKSILDTLRAEACEGSLACLVLRKRAD